MKYGLDSDVCVGVFWGISGQICGKKEILDARVHVMEGMVDSQLEHWQVWEAPDELANLPDHREDHEYFSFPRGRVLYDLSLDRLVIYCDSALMGLDTKEQIASFFGFSPKEARWRTDDHYTTETEAIRKLFEYDI